MLLRIWQGKSVLTSFLLPLLIHHCFKIYKGDYSWRRWLLGFGIIVAGTGSSVIGIYMLPVAYMVYGLPLVVILIYKKEFKSLLLAFKRLIITMLPIIVMVGFVLYGAISGKWGGEFILTAQTKPDWIYTYNITFSGSYMVYLLIASVIVLVIDYICNLKKKDVVEGKLRFLLVVFALVLFLTFLNPLFCDFVSEHITGMVVYWRLYWILSMELIIAVAFALVIENIGIRVAKYGVALAASALIMISGRYMYSKNFLFEPHQNYYKIPNEVLCVSDYVLEKKDNPVCIFPERISYYPRQYDTNIIVIGARQFVINQKKIGDSEFTYAWLYYSIYLENRFDDENVRWALDEVGVDYIYMDYKTANGFSLEPNSFDSPYYTIDEVPGYGYIYSLN